MTLESVSTSSAAVAAATLLLLDQYSSSVDDLVFSFLIHPWLRRCRINRFYAERRRYYERKKWSVFCERLTERQFVRYFRMSKGLFEKLCNKIEGSVGSARFKSEEYLDNILNPPGPISEYTNNQWKISFLLMSIVQGGLFQVRSSSRLPSVFLEGGHIWIWHYCLKPASITHTRLSSMSCRTGFATKHFTQSMA